MRQSEDRKVAAEATKHLSVLHDTIKLLGEEFTVNGRIPRHVTRAEATKLMTTLVVVLLYLSVQ
jgi:hypothetical protein